MPQEERKLQGLTRFAVLFFIFFSPVSAYLWIAISGGNTLLYEDGLIQFFPFRVFLHNAFTNGFSPQWVPFSACGFSLLAEGQSGICFPATQIIYRLFSPEVGWMLESFLGRLVAFVLCWLYLKKMNIKEVGSFFGASVYAFCGASYGMESVPSIMWCYALLPGILLSCELFLEKKRLSFVFLTIGFSLLFLTGHPVMIIYVGMIISVYLLFQLVNQWQGGKSFRQTGLLVLELIGSALVATLIASPQLLPMLQLLPFSARTVGTGITLDGLQNTMHLRPSWLPLSLFPTPLYWGELLENFSNSIRYPLFALFLSCVGMLFGGRSPRRGYFILLCVFSTLMALGPYVGLWKLVHSLPVLNHFRYPFRWLLFLPICVSYLSACGMDQLLNRSEEFPPIGFERIRGIVIFTVLGAGAVFLIRYHNSVVRLTQKAIESSPWLTGLLWFCFIGMMLAIYLSLTKGSIQHGVLLGAALTIISSSATIAFNIEDPISVRNLDIIGLKGDNLPNNHPQPFRTSTTFSPGEVFLTNTMHSRYHYTPNLTILDGTLTTGYYFSFFPYWSAKVSNWCQDALNGDEEKQIYLNLSAARWLFPREGSSFQSSSLSTETFRGAQAYVNTNALTRASVVSSCRLFSNEKDLLTFLESPGLFDPRREMTVLRQDAAGWNLPSEAGDPEDPVALPEARIVAERPDRIEIELEPAAPGGAFLVLSDTYYPGWRALADGVEAKVVRTNYAFRGVKLPEGAKRVVFFFDPLVPDAALPLPTFLLAGLGTTAIGLRRWLNNRSKTALDDKFREI